MLLLSARLRHMMMPSTPFPLLSRRTRYMRPYEKRLIGGIWSDTPSSWRSRLIEDRDRPELKKQIRPMILTPPPPFSRHAVHLLFCSPQQDIRAPIHATPAFLFQLALPRTHESTTNNLTHRPTEPPPVHRHPSPAAAQKAALLREPRRAAMTMLRRDMPELSAIDAARPPVCLMLFVIDFAAAFIFAVAITIRCANDSSREPRPDTREV